jgi:phage repressor protein C with HTH and peptisase S24 domain
MRRCEMKIETFPVAASEFISILDIHPGSRTKPGTAVVPPGILNPSNLSAARIFGESMSPRIRNRGWAIFSHDPPISPQDRLVLVEEQTECGRRYTLKKYHRRQLLSGAVEVLLLPLNPAFEPILLQPDDEKYRIRVWFVANVRRISRVREPRYRRVDPEP